MTLQRDGVESCRQIWVFVCAQPTSHSPSTVSTHINIMPVFWATWWQWIIQIQWVKSLTSYNVTIIFIKWDTLCLYILLLVPYTWTLLNWGIAEHCLAVTSILLSFNWYFLVKSYLLQLISTSCFCSKPADVQMQMDTILTVFNTAYTDYKVYWKINTVLLIASYLKS